MMTPQAQPASSSVDQDGRDKWLQTRPGELCFIRVPAADTNGAYSVVEILSSPGDSTPMHTHMYEDEYIFVVEGTALIACGDRTFEASVGETAVLPRGVPHAWGNPSTSQLRILVTCTPGGIEEVLRLRAEVGDGGVDMQVVREKFGVSVVGPLLIEA
jgi:mannose-6-phosphate isomerase-like protein (cupin superfamily)